MGRAKSSLSITINVQYGLSLIKKHCWYVRHQSRTLDSSNNDWREQMDISIRLATKEDDDIDWIDHTKG